MADDDDDDDDDDVVGAEPPSTKRRTVSAKDWLFRVRQVFAAAAAGANDATSGRVDRFIERPEADSAGGLVAAIPEQNPLVRFAPSGDGKLKLVPGLQDQNDYETIEALREEMNDPIETLSDRYALNPNAPQATLFGPLVSRYREELSKDPREINYVVLYARGARLHAARITSEREIRLGEWPTPDATESEAIDAVCDLHGPLIMASAVGRRLVSDARQYESTPDEERREREILEEFGEAIAHETEIFEPETVMAIADLTAPIGNDPQPYRTRHLRLLLAGSALVAIVGGFAWMSLGPAAGIPSVVALNWFFLEGLKKSNSYKTATEAVGKSYDQFEKTVDARAIDVIRLLNNIVKFAERRRGLLEAVAGLRPEFGWATKILKKESILDEGASSEVSNTGLLPDRLTQHVIIFDTRSRRFPLPLGLFTNGGIAADYFEDYTATDVSLQQDTAIASEQDADKARLDVLQNWINKEPSIIVVQDQWELDHARLMAPESLIEVILEDGPQQGTISLDIAGFANVLSTVGEVDFHILEALRDHLIIERA